MRFPGPYGATGGIFNAMRTACESSGSGSDVCAPGRSKGRSAMRGPARGAAAILFCLALAGTPAVARVPVILDFGDSLTAGYGLPAGQAFPARLEDWLRRRGIEARVVNAGVSGDTTA